MKPLLPLAALLVFLVAACSTLVTVGAAASGAAIGAAVAGPAGAAAGAVAGWGTAEGIEHAQLQATLTNKALDQAGRTWFEVLIDSITPLVWVLLLVGWLAPAPQDLWRRWKEQKRLEEEEE